MRDRESEPAPRDAEVEGPAMEAQDTGVREVVPGTLPTVVDEYRIPLKPITADTSDTPGGSNRRPGETRPGGAPGNRTPQASAAGGPEELREMVYIPAGYFLMGSPSTSSVGGADEQPQSEVFVDAFYIDKYPVTNRHFFEFVMGSGYKAEGSWDRYYDQATMDLPVESSRDNADLLYEAFTENIPPLETAVRLVLSVAESEEAATRR